MQPEAMDASIYGYVPLAHHQLAPPIPGLPAQLARAPAPPPPLSPAMLFHMGFHPDDVGRALAQARGEVYVALDQLHIAAAARAEPLAPRACHSVPRSAHAARPEPAAACSQPPEPRVKKKRSAPRHKREALAFLEGVEKDAEEQETEVRPP